MADSHTRISTNSHKLFIVSGGLFVVDGDFYYAVFFVFEDAVGFRNAAEGEAVGDEWGGVYLSLLNKAEHLLAVATIHATCLEGEVLAVHLWQGQHLRFVIESHHGDCGVWSGAAPCQLECIPGASHLQHAVGTAVVAVLAHKLLALIGCREQNFGIMCAHKLPSLLRRFAHDDALWLLEHDAQQGTDARGTSPYDE